MLNKEYLPYLLRCIDRLDDLRKSDARITGLVLGLWEREESCYTQIIQHTLGMYSDGRLRVEPEVRDTAALRRHIEELSDA